MQLSIDSSWIVNFQTASGISLILWEETLDKERDEVINDFFSGVSLWEWYLALSLQQQPSMKYLLKGLCENNSSVKLETAV